MLYPEIDFLNDYFQAELNIIHDEAGNKHLIGYSEMFGCNVFVKVFTSSDMFYSEQHVNQVYCPNIYLDSLIFDNQYIVILKDRKLEDIDEDEVTLDVASQFGKLLANFHEKLENRASVYDNPNSLSTQIKDKLDKLQATDDASKLNSIYKLVEPSLEQADVEYEQLPKVILHGDFSVRNIMRYEGDYILIDFERSHMGITYEDFIKFFFNEVHDIKLRQSFLNGYRSVREFEIPQRSVQQSLLFLCSLEILEYNLNHENKKYGSMAYAMLDAIERDDVIFDI